MNDRKPYVLPHVVLPVGACGIDGCAECAAGRWVPPEVVLNHHGNQVLARRANGEHFRQYLECSEGCGFLIGCGDAAESIAHDSCLARSTRQSARAQADADRRLQDVDMAQYADLDIENDPLLLSLLAMGTRNRNEAAFMLHMAPLIAAHLHAEGWVKGDVGG